MNRLPLSIVVTIFVLTATSPSPLTAKQDNLPEGHPVVSTPKSMDEVIPDVPKDTGTGAMSLSWADPPSWISEPPANSMRRAQYQIPGDAGPGECVVFYFGPGQGGEPQANVRRWADQFTPSDGHSAQDALVTESVEVNGISVLLAEIAGTYRVGRSMGGSGGQKPDYMLLGAVATGPDANWFFKLTGPIATIEANREAFRAMINSLRFGEQP